MTLAVLRGRAAAGDLSAGVLADHYAAEGLMSMASKSVVTTECRRVIDSLDLSTNQKLTALGFTTQPSTHGCKKILLNGEVLFDGRAHDVEQWLRERDSWE